MVSLTTFSFLKWASLLFFVECISVLSLSGQPPKDGFTQIFDGKTFNGWEGDTSIWRIENGVIIGETSARTRLKSNSFLIWTAGQSNDFELKLEFRISEEGNSGINYRSERVKDHQFALKGYQVAVDGKHIHTGENYEERGRGLLAKHGESSILAFRQKPIINSLQRDPGTLVSSNKVNDWNECLIVARGNKLQHYINGILISEVIDNDKTLRKSSGYLGLQVHVGPPMKTQYRNIRIKPLL
jgi:Domain of Unknown Function (DUF1080)